MSGSFVDREVDGRCLSEAAAKALCEALQTLPDDRANPAPLCARIADIMDMLRALSKRKDLDLDDRAIFVWWALSDRALTVCAQLSLALDVARSLARRMS